MMPSITIIEPVICSELRWDSDGRGYMTLACAISLECQVYGNFKHYGIGGSLITEERK